MLTPIEIQGKTFKSGMGYTKRQVDMFLEEIYDNYEMLYKENMELKDKVNVLNEGLQYYKTIEKTLQKALILAEKTSEETQKSAVDMAASIEKEAHAKAALILSDAKNDLQRIHNQIIHLAQQYEKYRAQYKQLAATQIEILNSESFQINFNDLPDSIITNEKSIKDQNPSLSEEILGRASQEKTKSKPVVKKDKESMLINDDFAELQQSLMKQQQKQEPKEESKETKANDNQLKSQHESANKKEKTQMLADQIAEQESEAALTDIFKRLNIKLNEKEGKSQTEEIKEDTKPDEDDDAFEFL